MFKKLIPVLCTAVFLAGCSGKIEQKESAHADQEKEMAAEQEKKEKEHQEALEQEQLRREQLVQEAIERVREKEDKKRPETIVLDPGHSGVVA